MKNENLLDNNNKENDKEEIVISLKTLRQGKIIMTVLFAVLIIIEFTIKDRVIYNTFALFFGYIMTETFYKFKARKDNLDLFGLIIYLLMIIFYIYLYITRG